MALAVLAPGAHALTLEDAVRLAVERNERAAIAGSQAEAAGARVARARAFFFPELALSGGYTRRAFESVRNIGGQNVTLQAIDGFAGAASLRWTLFDARAFPLYRAARIDFDAAQGERDESRRLLGFEAAGAFVGTLGAEQVLQAAGHRVELARQSRDEARARMQAELARANDVTRAELELAAAELELARSRGERDNAILSLGYLIDLPVDAPLAEPRGLLGEGSDPANAPDLVAEARRRRLDVAARQSHAEALASLASEPALRGLPTLDLVGQLRATNEAGFTGRNTDGSVGLTLNWPLYDGGERYAERAERRAQAESARLDARALQRRVEVQVKSALVGIDSQRAALRQAETAAEASRKNAQEVAQLYRQGLARALDVADASQRRFEAEVGLARARYGLALARLDLRAALGLDALGEEPDR